MILNIRRKGTRCQTKLRLLWRRKCISEIETRIAGEICSKKKDRVPIPKINRKLLKSLFIVQHYKEIYGNGQGIWTDLGITEGHIFQQSEFPRAKSKLGRTNK